MRVACPHCGHNAVIVCYAAPIGGYYFDEELQRNIPRIRCAKCEKTISPLSAGMADPVHVPEGAVVE